jgi:acetyl-CoA carboxylase carboxyltransferase component
MIQNININKDFPLHIELLGNVLDDAVIEDIGGSHADQFDGVYCGVGSHKYLKFVFVIQDFKYKGGSAGVTNCLQIIASIERAIEEKCPLLFFISTGGARLQEGVLAIHQTARIVNTLSKASGYIPTIAVVKGTAAALGAYITSICDFAIFVKGLSQVFLTGPKVIETAMGKSVDKELLGGLKVHSEITGIATQIAEDIQDAQHILIRLLKILPRHPYNFYPIPFTKLDESINPKFDSILPSNNRVTYDMTNIISNLIDWKEKVDFIPEYAKNLITVLGHLNGTTVGIVANQPKINSGCLDVKSSLKLSRFIQICDAYNIPLLFLVDCPGFLPGEQQEKSSAVSIGTRTSHILASATCVKITVIIRRIIGGSFAVMNTKAIGADYVMAWPNAQLSIMSSQAATKINDSNCEDFSLNNLLKEGILDEIIQPNETRSAIIKAINKVMKIKKVETLVKRRNILPI